MRRKDDGKIKEDDLEKLQSFSIHSTSTSFSSRLKELCISFAHFFRRFSITCKAFFWFFVCLCLLRIAWWISTKSHSSSSSSSINTSMQNLLSQSSLNVNNDTTQHTVQAYQQRLTQLHQIYLSDSDALHKQFNIKSNIPTFEEYRSNLRSTYERYFASRNHEGRDPYEIWKRVSEHLDPTGSSGNGEIKTFPKIISSSAKDKGKVLERESFQTWKQKNHGWRIDLFDDNDADNFIKKTFSNLGRNMESSPNQKSSNQRTYIEILSFMPKNIMRVDTYRYFKIFFDGGLYVDSDTSCRKSIEQWPGVFSSDAMVADQSDFILKFLSNFNVDQKPTDQADDFVSNILKALGSFFHFTSKQEKELNFWKQPSLVMAIEEDSFLAREDWVAMTFARPLQATQWAFMAQPFHPIFLDALGTILNRTERFIDHKEIEGEKEKSLNYVLEWTGPGMLTDAIFRYLGAVHGISPHQMLYNHKGMRLGDILMYPHMAFRSPDDSTDPLFTIGHHHLHEWW